MASFRKSVAVPGSYQTPEGPATVTSARIQHWHDSINEMVGLGIRPPVSWGHVSTSTPHTDDDAAFWASKYNAGKVTGAEIDEAGELFLLGDAAGLSMRDGELVTQVELAGGMKVETAIGEVSIGVRDWTSGDGRDWKDVPIHLALTPLPVIVPPGGQSPFAPDSGQSFGLASLLTRFGTAPPVLPKPDNKAADNKAADKTDPPDESKDDGKTGASAEACVAMLAKVGVVLPEDTNAANFLERVYVACTALETAMQTDPADATKGAKEEAPGTYLSTLRAKDPVVASLIEEKESRDRAALLSDIAALVKMGLAPHRAKAWRERATTQRFSLGIDNKPVASKLREEVDLAKELLAGSDHGRQLFGTAVQEVAAPEDEANNIGARLAAVEAEFVKNVGLPARQTATAGSK